jgi:hypothetical protein
MQASGADDVRGFSDVGRAGLNAVSNDGSEARTGAAGSGGFACRLHWDIGRRMSHSREIGGVEPRAMNPS